MRTGIGIVAVCGIVGLGFGLGTAADESAAGKTAPTATSPGPQYFSRSGRSDKGVEIRSAPRKAQPASSKPAQNFYDDLFGGEPAAAADAPVGQPLGGVTQAEYTRDPSQRDVILQVQNPSNVQAVEEFLPDAFVPQTATAAPAQQPSFVAVDPLLPIRPATNAVVDASALSLQSPAVSVQWIKRADVNVGEECECELLVANSGQATATDVAIEAAFPKSIRIVSASPEPAKKQGQLTWSLPTLEPGAEKRLTVRFVATERGEVNMQAFVRFTGAASGRFNVEEPMLRVSMQGPDEVTLGDPASQIVIVANPGTGVAHNVIIEATMPAGLEHALGERLAMNVGSLAPGETRQVRLGLAAVQGGKQTVHVEARSGANLRQAASATVNVIAPSVKVAMEGPGLRYIGRNATYRIAVTNDGAAVSNNVRIMHKVPAGFQFVQADKGGKFDAQTQAVHWFIGRLEAGQTLQVSAELVAAKPGQHVHVTTASSAQGLGAEARCTTQVEGAAALILEIVDLDDPVEVGAETGYEIRIRNEGSAPAANIALSCELPEAVDMISAESPTEYVTERGLLVFKSLSTLGPGKAAIFRIHVRGTAPGNHRFRARLTSDSVHEPLVFEEITKFYGE